MEDTRITQLLAQMLVLLGFLIISALLSLPDTDQVGRKPDDDEYE